jgi:hypothetical protein
MGVNEQGQPVLQVVEANVANGFNPMLSRPQYDIKTDVVTAANSAIAQFRSSYRPAS